VATCGGGTVIGNVGVDDDQSAQLINLGDLGTGLHEWWAGTLDGLNPQTQSLLPPTVQHCDADAALHAEQYLQSIAPGFTAATLGVDVLNCNPDDIVVAINSCLERGDDSTYGFQAQCCPPPPPPNDPTTGTNCYSYCVSGPNFPVQISMASLTQDYAPGNPTYADPATICQDLIGDTTAWMDQNVPGGPSPVGGPLLCGVNWGVNMGGWYVPGTLATTCNVTAWNDWAQCMGDARVEICMEFQCLMEPGEPLKPERDG
jgi:hypothetical protein